MSSQDEWTKDWIEVKILVPPKTHDVARRVAEKRNSEQSKVGYTPEYIIAEAATNGMFDLELYELP